MSLQGVKKHRVRVIGLSVNSSCSGRNIAIYLEITTCDWSYSLVAISSIFSLILESFQASPKASSATKCLHTQFRLTQSTQVFYYIEYVTDFDEGDHVFLGL